MNPRYQRTQKFMYDINTELFTEIIDIPKIELLNPQEEESNNFETENNSNSISLNDMEMILSEIKFINLDIIDRWVQEDKVFPNFWNSISSNYKFDISWYQKYPDKSWDPTYWCFSENFDISWCLQYPNLNWSWVDISRHSNLKLEWIKENPLLPWCWVVIATYPNLNLEWLDILANQKCKSKIWRKLSDHPNLKLSWLKKYSYFPWKWDYISDNRNLRLEWLQTFPYKTWNWKSISDSPNLEYSWYLAFPNKNWSLSDMMMNLNFISSYREYQAIRYMSAYKIQKWWRKILYNPRSNPGIRFISRMYDENFTHT